MDLAEAYGVELEPQPTRDESDPFAAFDAKNPFGFPGMLSHSTWCAPHANVDDPAPLVQVGGAMEFYPWQGGWEATLFLTRVLSRTAFDGRHGAPRGAVRPVVRLGP